MKQIILACLQIVQKFFENLKKQLKKSEFYINFGEEDVGHLIPLTVGHTDRPTEDEAKYIRTVIKHSNFRYIPEEFEGISPSPWYRPLDIKSGIIPKI